MKKTVAQLLLPFSDPANAWQLQLLRRLLAIALGLTVLLLLRDLASGLEPRYSIAAMGVVLTGMVVVRRRERLGRGVAAALFLASVLVLAAAAWFNPMSPGPALCLSMLPCTFAAMLEGPAFGGLLSGLVLALLAGLAWARPPAGLMASYRMVNEGLMVCFGFSTAWAIDYTFHRMQSVAQQRNELLRGLAEAGQAMATALFQDLRPLLADLRACLQAPGANPAQAGPSVAALVGRLAAARTLYQAESDDRAAGPAWNLDQARRYIIRATLGTLGLIMAVVLLRNLVWGGGLISVLGILAALPCLLWGLDRRPGLFSPARVNALFLGVAFLATIKSFSDWGGTADSPTLVMPPCLMLVACTLNGPWVIGATFLAGVLVLAWAARLPLSTDQFQLLTDLALLQAILGLVATSVVQLRQAFVLQLQSQAQAMAEGLRLRRRLAGTLFHDVNNQLWALNAYLELSVSERSDPAAALAKAGRLCDRISALVTASKDFLEGDQPLDLAKLRPVPVSALFADTQGLFSGRLGQKQQRLILGEGAGLALLGLPEIVTESILGNLVSNAIKFSPRGSVIHVDARHEGGEVALRVRDAGPGIAQALIDGLNNDGPLPSSPGSEGEAGQGHGLQLVREHLSRQGGRLELIRPEQGGTLAVAWLRSA
jgi:signal transduction histidine kinase